MSRKQIIISFKRAAGWCRNYVIQQKFQWVMESGKEWKYEDIRATLEFPDLFFVRWTFLRKVTKSGSTQATVLPFKNEFSFISNYRCSYRIVIAAEQARATGAGSWVVDATSPQCFNRAGASCRAWFVLALPLVPTIDRDATKCRTALSQVH